MDSGFWIMFLIFAGIELLSVVGIFSGRRLMKNEEWRATGIVILVLSGIGAVVSGFFIILYLIFLVEPGFLSLLTGLLLFMAVWSVIVQ